MDYFASYPTTQKHLLNHGWQFLKLSLASNPQDASTYQTKDGTAPVWKSVDLPHDWLIGQVKELYEDSLGLYKRTLSYDAKAKADRSISLRFDGVYMDSTLYVNGVQAGEWKYGYSTFEFDITDYLKDGENEIQMAVRHQSPNSRWYSGAGIYRNVWLIDRPLTAFAPDGIYVTTECTSGWQNAEGAEWNMTVRAELKGTERLLTEGTLSLKCILYDADGQKTAGKEAACALTASEGIQNASCGKLSMTVTAPKLWEQKNPYLYTLVTELLSEGEILDSCRERIGFRTIHYDSEQGFFLNGRHVKLNGACMHHDLASLGSAVNSAAIRRQFDILRKMGVVAVRTSHNMPAVELMDIADETGMLIVSEAFDMWEHPKTTYDYARFFREWMALDVAAWIRRDRNRPSVILWSIGNEIYDTHADAHGEEITRALVGEVRKHDPAEHAPITIGSNFMPWQGAQNCADIVKFAGYNYSEKYYADHHTAHPDWLIYGSETASTVQSRGVYHFPLRQSILSDEDEQCSSLGNSTTSWGARSTEGCIVDDANTAFSAGQFIWTGFDYIGEPTPYHTKNSYFGQVDTAGFPKDSYYIYRSAWTSYKEAPFVYIFPYWDFSVGQTIDVRVASNAPWVELKLNGRSLGRRFLDHTKETEMVADYQLTYEPGVLEAVAYDEEDTVIAESSRHSFGDAARITLKADKTVLRADGMDLSFIEIGMEDREGYPVENANNRVHVTVSGAGRLIGLDNGDSTDFEEYKSDCRRLFSGKLLVILAATLDAGAITVMAESEGMEPAKLHLMSQNAEKVMRPFLAGSDNCRASFKEMLRENPSKAHEIPVRKIEILPVDEDGNILKGEDRTFSTERREICYQAICHPANATDKSLTWRLTTDSGADSNLAKFELLSPDKIRVTALGDGNFRVRASVKNGGDSVHLFHSVDASVTGLGAAAIDPYHMVSASLYTLKGGPITNGNELGIATSREEISWVGFERVDFGSVGSDRVNLPIFEIDNSPFDVEIWDGVPTEETSELLCRQTYAIPSIWNTYQAMDFTLTKKIKGMHTLCFLTRAHKMHLKGFCFYREEKAYATLEALRCDAVYGDSFTKTEHAITGIGNNVSLVYEDMDFGDTGFTKLIICGRTPMQKNSIHVRFTDTEGTEVKQIAEFMGTGDGASSDYAEQTFALEPVYGMQKVTFVFMPGSRFDFAYFRFER